MPVKADKIRILSVLKSCDQPVDKISDFSILDSITICRVWKVQILINKKVYNLEQRKVLF